MRAMELGEKSGLNSIVAARAAHELREFDKRDSLSRRCRRQDRGRIHHAPDGEDRVPARPEAAAIGVSIR